MIVIMQISAIQTKPDFFCYYFRFGDPKRITLFISMWPHDYEQDGSTSRADRPEHRICGREMLTLFR